MLATGRRVCPICRCDIREADLFDACSDEEARLQEAWKEGAGAAGVVANADYGAKASWGWGLWRGFGMSKASSFSCQQLRWHQNAPLVSKQVLPLHVQVSALLAELTAMRAADPEAKAVVFSSWGRLLRLVGDALEANGVQYASLCGANLTQRQVGGRLPGQGLCECLGKAAAVCASTGAQPVPPKCAGKGGA